MDEEQATHDNSASTEVETAAAAGEDVIEKDSSLHGAGGGSSSSIEEDEYASIENQEWHNDPSEKCNLIVNYLPHEIDDASLKVTDNWVYYCTKLPLLVTCLCDLTSTFPSRPPSYPPHCPRPMPSAESI